MKETLLNGWHPMRWFRLVLGLVAAYQGVVMHDGLSGAIAAFLLVQAVTNTGCGGGACMTPPVKKATLSTDEVEFEEIK